MDYGPLIMMGLMGLVAGWIANTLLGNHADLLGSLIPGVLGAFIQSHLQLDVMRLGNPLLEKLTLAVVGAVVVILAARSIASTQKRH